jgi:hypothetical protein
MTATSFIYSVTLLVFFDVGYYSRIYATDLKSIKSKTDSIPLWVRQIYNEIDTSEFPNENKGVVFFKQLTDTSSFCLYTISTGTCFRTYLVTQRNRKTFQQFNIQEECDEELSEPEYSTYNYSLDSIRNTITVIFDTLKANAKFLRRKGTFTKFKTGFDMDNSETFHVKKTLHLLIKNDATFTIRDKNHRLRAAPTN